MEIRRLEAGDELALTRFVSRIPEGDRTFFKEDVLDADVVTAWVRRGEARSLAVEDSEVIGTVTVVPLQGWSSHVGEVRVIVDPHHRRRGVGRALARYAVFEALNLGLRKMVVEVIADQEATVGMFRSLGFEPEALLRDHVCDDDGNLHDLMLLAHSVEASLASLEAVGPRRRGRMKRGNELRVADVVREAASVRGGHVAIRHRDRELTYAELDERSNRLAQALRAAGVGKGSRVAHLDRTAPEIVELLFATSKLGAVTVPLNWRLAPAELAAVVADAQPDVLLAGDAYADVAAPIVVVVGAEYERWLAAHEPVDPGGRGESNDTVLQLYTSGTTGVPKGVLTTNRNLAAAAESSPLWEFDAATISMTPLPMFHIGGIGWAFLGLWNAATTVLISEFVPEDVLDVLERQRVTNTIFVPTMLQLLCAVPGAEERDYSALRSIAYGASPITAASATSGCCESTSSTSIGYTFSPPLTIMSLIRSVRNR